MANTQFYNDDINIADFRILISMWDRKKADSDYFLDISSLATSDISIKKERNTPDTLEVTIEYTQFKEKLNYEGTSPENILMPFITEVKIQRNFETIFAGTLFHMSLALGEVNKELLTLQCCSWGQHLEKRFVGQSFNGTLPQIAQQLVLAGQHELNWFDNYAWEYEDDYMQGWEWNKNKYTEDGPARSTNKHWGGGILLEAGDSIWTYSMQPANMMGNDKHALKPLIFSFYYKSSANGQVILTAHSDNNNEIGAQLFSYTVNVTATNNWTLKQVEIPSQRITNDVHWLKLTIQNANIDLSDLNLYTKSQQGDAYDLDISIGSLIPLTHRWSTGHIRHYHRQKIKDAIEDIAKLTSIDGTNTATGAKESDTFEFEFDENKRFNIYYRQGTLIADPAFTAEYPGNIKSLTLERGLEDINNLLYASAEEQQTYKGVTNKYTADEATTTTKKWTSAYSSSGSMQRFGAQVDFKDFSGVSSYAALGSSAESDLQIFDEIQNTVDVEVDSNIYNMGNIHLGDAVIVSVLTDRIFRFVNGTYRVYSIECNISKDSVETVKLTLIPIDKAELQIISFPKQYKSLCNDIKRLKVK